MSTTDPRVYALAKLFLEDEFRTNEKLIPGDLERHINRLSQDIHATIEEYIRWELEKREL